VIRRWTKLSGNYTVATSSADKTTENYDRSKTCKHEQSGIKRVSIDAKAIDGHTNSGKNFGRGWIEKNKKCSIMKVAKTNSFLHMTFTSIFTVRLYASAVYAVVVCPSVRLSVRPSITRRYCIKTAKRRMTQHVTVCLYIPGLR